MNRRLGLLLSLLALIWVGVVAAQDPTVCPPNALLSYVRAGAVCQGDGTGAWCYGNGTALLTGADQLQGDPFEVTGGRVAAGLVQSVGVTTASLDAPDYGVVSGRLRLTLTDPDARAVNVLLFGNATIENLVPSVTEVLVTSTGTLRIRQSPVFNAPILDELLVREGTLAHGKSEDGAWLRVVIPGTNDLGWVSLEVAQVMGDPATLPVVDVDTPFQRPFEVMRVISEDVPLCGEGIAANGVLFQTPNTEDEVAFTLNGVNLRVAGTIFVEADEQTTRITVLSGGVLVAETAVYVPSGAEITLPDGEPIPYDQARLLGLPGNNLTPRVTVDEPLDAETIIARLDAYNAPVPTVVPTPTTNPDACRYIARRELRLSAGPGTFYESNGVVEIGSNVFPTTQNVDADGATWYELDNGSWVQAANVTQTGVCQPIPVLDFVEAPRTNKVVMERCETTNGPLREGQRVTFEFMPPAADNYPEIESAVRTDPGRINVEQTALRVRATDPILIASDPERWIRVYTGQWEAVAGTYRVESRRLSYILICNLTVRAG
jgi:hypothetical protein